MFHLLVSEYVDTSNPWPGQFLTHAQSHISSHERLISLHFLLTRTARFFAWFENNTTTSSSTSNPFFQHNLSKPTTDASVVSTRKRQKLAKRDSVFNMQTVTRKILFLYPCVVGRAGSHTVRPTPSSTPSKEPLMQRPTGATTLTTAAIEGDSTPTTAAFEGQ